MYFEQTVNLLSGAVFTEDLLNTEFSYKMTGFVDFARLCTVPEPATLVLTVLGLAGIGYQRRKQIKAA